MHFWNGLKIKVCKIYSMLLISHRGNLNGPNSELENSEAYIIKALTSGFAVEVDLWVKDGSLFLGHDSPIHKTSLEFFKKHNNRLWIHCKNLEALNYLLGQDGMNFFWHETDDYTLTSKGYIWTYFDKSVGKNNVIVIKGKLTKEDLPDCYGVCSDFPELLK